MVDQESQGAAFAERYPLTITCVSILAFLGNIRTYLVLNAALEEPAASAMTHVYSCQGCRYRLAGLRRLN